jgi:hypothetical protein
VDGDDGDSMSLTKDVDAWVALERDKSSGAKLGINCTIPLIQHLLEAIERLIQFTNMIGFGWIDIAFRLVNVDLLSEISM